MDDFRRVVVAVDGSDVGEREALKARWLQYALAVMPFDVRVAVAYQAVREGEDALREAGRLREQACADAKALADLRGDVAELREQNAELRERNAELFRTAVTAQRRLRELRPGDSGFSFGRDGAPPVRHVANEERSALVPVVMETPWPPAPIEGEDGQAE
uniref:hypothetical protein n=1 Tax=Myxococcus fulvus TaxID=33 RepID=UPI0034E065A9